MDTEILIPLIIVAVAVGIAAFVIWLKVGTNRANKIKAELPDMVQQAIGNYPTLAKHSPLIVEYVQNETLVSLAAGISIIMKMKKNKFGYVKCDDPTYDIIKFSLESEDTTSASGNLGITVGNREQMKALLGAFALCIKFICECEYFKGSTVEVSDTSTSSVLRLDYTIG